jgi:hypothetical protein
MQITSTKLRYVPILLLALIASFASGQQLNPATQFNWPLVTGSGTPTAACTSANYGQPYQNTGVTPNTFYTCGTDGWATRGGSSFTLNTLSGAVTLAVGAGLSITPSGNTITINLATPFTINSFTGCSGSFELGYTVTNPTCSATYSTTPSSAQITNTDSVDSPLTLSSPYTSGTIVGSFSHSATATTTITLTAIGSSTQTANQTYTWKPRIFGGVAASGATSTVTASGATAVLSNSTAIASAGLGAETVGQVIGSYTPSGQAIYLLLTGGSHTFTDNNTGFPMAFNAPLTVTFTNVNGVTLTMYLYQTTNSLYANFAPKVAS